MRRAAVVRVELSASGTRIPGGSRAFERRLATLGAWAARRAGRPVHLSVAVVSDEQMAVLNERHLGHAGPTDVLAFPMAWEPDLDGELLLSAETARREARARGHLPADELTLYAAHGLCHLLGHEDHDAVTRRRMRRAEREALATVGLGPLFGPPRA